MKQFKCACCMDEPQDSNGCICQKCIEAGCLKMGFCQRMGKLIAEKLLGIKIPQTA